MRTWTLHRRRTALLALACAVATGALGVVLDPAGSPFGMTVYVAAAVLALFRTAAITLQVILGQLLVADLLVGMDGPAALLTAPMVLGVIATAELAAIVARLDTPLVADPAEAPARAGVAALIGCGVFAAVALVVGLPGPGGVAAAMLGAGALAWAAGRTGRGWGQAADRPGEVGASGRGSAVLPLAMVAFGACATLAAPGHAYAQAAQGRVTSEVDGRPVQLAQVALVEVGGRVAARTLTDSAGRYFVRVDRPGDFKLRADLLGYQRLETPLLALAEGDTVRASFELPLDPIELEGLRVEAEAVERIRDELRMWGVRIDDLGERFVDRAAIERRPTARDFGEVLRGQSVPGMQVIRSDEMGTGGKPRICVALVRRGGCAIIALNGVRVSETTAALVPPEALRAVVVLQPIEAALVFGTGGGNGAVLLFTGSGSGRR